MTTVIAAACMQVQYDKERNLQKIIRFIEEASRKNARLVVFPELALQGFCWDPSEVEGGEQKRYYYDTAEPIPGPSTNLLIKYAKQHQTYIQLGMAEKAPVGGGAVLYDSAVLLGPGGLIGVFRKVHTGCDAIFNPGNSMPVWQTPVANLGPIICYDLCFPEMVRIQALKGAEIITMTTAWPMKGDDPQNDYYGYAYDLLGKANAMMNQVWLIQANAVGVPIGNKSTANYYGHTRIISPSGQTVTEIGHDEGLVTSDVNVKDSILEARTVSFFNSNLFKDRRPELYGLIADNRLYEQPACM
jgi:predicted amidohydrolase